MVVSRAFCETAGPMPEDYFLYYEEVDWALRRGGLPLAYCADAVVHHRAGTAIGSPRPGYDGSRLSIYFKHRNRLRFLRRFRRRSWCGAMAFSVGKSAQILIHGQPTKAWTVLSASLGAPPPRSVRLKFGEDAQPLAFARQR